jgi:hypothetical protein
MLSRRALIGKAAVGAAAALAVGAAGAGVASARAARAATGTPADAGEGRDAAPAPAESAEIAAPPPWELLSPLAAGAGVAPGWRLVGLSPVQDGVCVVTLENAAGRSQRIHLCRNDGQPQGLVHTRRVDLVVMNDGHGVLPTDEGLAQAVARLGRVVAANEAQAPAGLLSHAERVERFAAALDGKLR